MIKNILKWFSYEDIINLHDKSLRLIQEIGFKLDDVELLKRLKKFDVKIDIENKTIKIPKITSEYFLSKIPKNITFFAVNSEFDIKLDKRRIYRPISGCINIIDDFYDTRKFQFCFMPNHMPP
ncbi:MAG: trimethylamine methyltransferase family protein [Actinobacteria bacterium]|nr:trimethylamine methyltransferase family protein [Actinomycetota bacterium]